MSDLFENSIVCGKCNTVMVPANVERNGFILRAVVCSKCNNKIIHPKDDQEYLHFMTLRKKQFNVKMRFVGNSYAVTIPKEIVNIMREQEKVMDDMVKLCLEEFGKVSLSFSSNLNKNVDSDKFNNTDLGLIKDKKNQEI